jgi:hypothetical protein
MSHKSFQKERSIMVISWTHSYVHYFFTEADNSQYSWKNIDFDTYKPHLFPCLSLFKLILTENNSKTGKIGTFLLSDKTFFVQITLPPSPKSDVKKLRHVHFRAGGIVIFLSTKVGIIIFYYHCLENITCLNNRRISFHVNMIEPHVRYHFSIRYYKLACL